MDINANDILELKKPHPCGGYSWLVLRAGMDVKIKCRTCGHETELLRSSIEKRIRKIIKSPQT